MNNITIENLTNYIMSVQSMVDRINIMQSSGSADFTHLNKRIEVVEKFEDLLLTELSAIYEK